MALASTSDESAIPTAIYGSIPRNVISMGLMTAAALIPAKPVPSPAPIPAKNVTNNVINKCKSDFPFLKISNVAQYNTASEKCQGAKEYPFSATCPKKYTAF